nr:bifunctional isocitrate dehydrogenase kinase/phosphatase [Desulfuromonadales bacterium]
KNFGVTRHGRVVFYDYDELSALGECVFKAFPEPAPGDELADVPPWGVGPGDVFPEEFSSFLGLPAELRKVFEHHHAELLTPEYWRGVQSRVAAGELIEVLPYDRSSRFLG